MSFLVSSRLTELEAHFVILRQQLAEQHAAGRGVIDMRHRLALLVHGAEPALDLGVQGHGLGVQRVVDLRHIAEHHALAGLLVHFDRQIIDAEHDVLTRRLPAGCRWRARRCCWWTVINIRDSICAYDRQRHVHRHLVAVEIGVEGRADQRMNLDGLAFDQHRLEGLDASRCRVGARLSRTDALGMTSSRISHTSCFSPRPTSWRFHRVPMPLRVSCG